MRWRRGFTLIEMVVALAVLGLLLGGLLQAYSSGLRTLDASEDYGRAALIARSVLDAVGPEIALEEGAAEGEVAPFYTWRAEIAPAAVEADEEPALPLFDVVVSVQWPPERRVQVSTQRLGQAP